MNFNVYINLAKTHYIIENTATGYPIALLPIAKTEVVPEDGKIVFKGQVTVKISPDPGNTVASTQPSPVSAEDFVFQVAGLINS